jgi:hypothetical protein
MNTDPQRQIHQLWAIAEMYHELAVSSKNQVEEAQLRLKIGEFAKQCEDPSYLRQNTALLYASAHLASSAIRLYSIEEVLKGQSKRWSEYDRIRNLTDKEAVKKDVVTQFNSLVHFLLRHMVAHSESEWKRYKKYKIAYGAMQDIYFDLDYNTIFDAMNVIVKSIGNDLGYSSY